MVAQSPARHAAHDRPDRRAAAASRRREQARIRRHLGGALVELGQRLTASLNDAQRATRERLIAELAAYRRASRFPRNIDFHDRRAPYFIDHVGTRCAVAHLMEKSGASALMHRIARDQNNAYVRELAGDAEIEAWLASVGLSVEEAARIQPAYCNKPSPAESCCASDDFMPRGIVEGVVESVDATKAIVVVNGSHGTVPEIVDGRVIVGPQGRATNDEVLVFFGRYGGPQAVGLDANGRLSTRCTLPDVPFPATIGKETVLAIADGGSCVDTILAKETDEQWSRVYDCEDEGGCAVGVGASDVGLAAVGIALAAATMRFRWRARRARRPRSASRHA